MEKRSGGRASTGFDSGRRTTGFDDTAFWGGRNNPASEANIASLMRHWRNQEWPIVLVQHDSTNPSSPLHPNSPGNALKDIISVESDLLVRKSVNSAFHGEPDLHAWLQSQSIYEVVIFGITTNHCCETTARVAGNLGYDTVFAIDATHTFGRISPEGVLVSAETLSIVTATNLHNEFAAVVWTSELLR